MPDYTGKYYNKIGISFIDVDLQDNILEFKFQGWPSQRYPLDHYHGDIFTWKMTAEESISKGHWPNLPTSVYLFYLDSDQGSGINTLKWVHDWTVPEGEIFVKDTFGMDIDGGQQELITLCKMNLIGDHRIVATMMEEILGFDITFLSQSPILTGF